VKITRTQLKRLIENEQLKLDQELTSVLKGDMKMMDQNVRILKKVDRHLEKITDIMDDLLTNNESSVLLDVLSKIDNVSAMYHESEILEKNWAGADSWEDVE